jgi:eukaryotic-like serine/threonine-protein kinase
LTPERWVQIEDLFHRAAECELESRPSFLDKECADDPELRREVEALLASEKSASDHMQAAVRSAFDTVGFPLVGETISHYHIVAALGGGGMGLVYRAEDLKLGRQVALKFLPEHSVKDSAALARFEREARSASALEHPNICPIYEFGEHEGQPFLVMQLLDGRTLRELIATAKPGESPLPIAELLNLAIQIADGLAAAHEKGIIHRDIKPANIFVTKQGQAKILDFGLAKLAPVVNVIENDPEPELAGHSEAESAKLDTPLAKTPDPYLSRTGVAMGTAGYMSPEQARGEKLDARTDLFSFGLVLYEMTTGRRAFQGDTGQELREAILKHTPAPLCEANPKLPSKLQATLEKALKKDRTARYQSASEIRSDLLHLKQVTEHHPRWKAALVGLLAVLSLATLAVWVYVRREPLSHAAKAQRLRQLTFNSFESRVTTGAISPDGKRLAYADPKGLRVQEIESSKIQAVSQPTELVGKQIDWDVVNTGWFPDNSRFIATSHAPGSDGSSPGSSIWVVSTDGTPPVKLRENASAYSVSRDGTLIAFGTNKGRLGDREIWFMNSNGEQARKILETDEDNSIAGTNWSPDEQSIIYVKGGKSGDSLVMRNLKTGTASTIISGPVMKQIGDLLWLPDGRLLYSVGEANSFMGSECNFWMLRIDPSSGKPLEPARKATDWNSSCMTTMSVTADGKQLAFLKWQSYMTGYMGDLATGGSHIQNVRHFPLSESSGGVVDWSPDGKTMLLVSDRTGTLGLYKQPLAADVAEGPLGVPPEDALPVCSRVTPDGKWVLYFAYGKTEGQPGQERWPVMRVPFNGGAGKELFMAARWSLFACGSVRASGCAIAEPSEDKKQLIVSVLDPLNGRGSELTRLPLDPSEDHWSFDLSADGRRFAFTKTPASPVQIFSLHGVPLHEFKPKRPKEVQEFSWAPDGKGLYVVAGARNGNEVLYMDLQGNGHSLWESTGANGETSVKPSPDGRHLAIATWATKGNIWLMEDF